MVACACLIFTSCDNNTEITSEQEIPQEVLAHLEAAEFDVDHIMVTEGGYIVEGDIFFTEQQILNLNPGSHLPHAEQYSTDNLVTGLPRVITMYAEEGGRKGYSPAMIAGLDEAIRRYNDRGLQITFQRTSNKNSADIVMTRLRKGDERRGVLGSAGFPTASGDPYGEIKMSGILESAYGLDTDGIATIIAHEMGHCIGFRHTDYFNRSISCGGSPTNEGDGGVGANHIPGTPTGADLAGNGSWMLSCADGSDRPFTSADRTALDYLY